MDWFKNTELFATGEPVDSEALRTQAIHEHEAACASDAKLAGLRLVSRDVAFSDFTQGICVRSVFSDSD